MCVIIFVMSNYELNLENIIFIRLECHCIITSMALTCILNIMLLMNVCYISVLITEITVASATIMIMHNVHVVTWNRADTSMCIYIHKVKVYILSVYTP